MSRISFGICHTLAPSGDSIKNGIVVNLRTQMNQLKANIDCTDFPHDCFILLQTNTYATKAMKSSKPQRALKQKHVQFRLCSDCVFCPQATCASSRVCRWSWGSCSGRWGVCELSCKTASRRTVPSNNWSSTSSWSRSWAWALLGLPPSPPSLPALRGKTSTGDSCCTVRRTPPHMTPTYYYSKCLWGLVRCGVVCCVSGLAWFVYLCAPQTQLHLHQSGTLVCLTVDLPVLPTQTWMTAIVLPMVWL